MTEVTGIAVEWIASPSDSRKIIDEINTKYVIVSSSQIPLVTGSVEYTYLLLPQKRLDGKLESLIKTSTYQQLEIEVDFGDLTLNQRRSQAVNLKSIIREYFKTTLQIRLDDVLYHDDKIGKFTPITGQRPLYYSQSQLQAIKQDLVDLNLLLDYQLLASDPLVWYYLKSNQILFDDLTLFHQLVLVKTNQDQTQINEIQLGVESLRRREFFTIEVSDKDRDTLIEFLENFKINFYDEFTSPDGQIYFMLDEVYNPGLPIKTWISLNYNRKFPIWYVYGSWVQDVDPSQNNRACLQAAAITAVKSILDTNDQSISSELILDKIKVSPNLSIALPVKNYDEVIKFKQVLMAIYPLIGTWTPRQYDDRKTAELHLAVIRKFDPTLKSVITQVDDTIYLVIPTESQDFLSFTIEDRPLLQYLESLSQDELQALIASRSGSLLVRPYPLSQTYDSNDPSIRLMEHEVFPKVDVEEELPPRMW